MNTIHVPVARTCNENHRLGHSPPQLHDSSMNLKKVRVLRDARIDLADWWRRPVIPDIETLLRNFGSNLIYRHVSAGFLDDQCDRLMQVHPAGHRVDHKEQTRRYWVA